MLRAHLARLLLAGAAALSALYAPDSNALLVTYGAGPVNLHEGRLEWKLDAGAQFDGVHLNTVGGLLGALNATNATVGGTFVTEYWLQDGLDAARVAATVTMPLLELRFDDSGRLQETSAGHGPSLMTFPAPSPTGGGPVGMERWRVDPASKTVYADLEGPLRLNDDGELVRQYDLPNTALWTFDAVTGPGPLPVDTLYDPPAFREALVAAGYDVFDFSRLSVHFRATQDISRLRLTAQGLAFFTQALELDPNAAAAWSAVNDDPNGWGSLRLTSTMSVVLVPEPSTWAMVLAGLGMCAVCARAARPSARG